MKITTDYYKLTALPKLFIIECYLSWDERVAASFTADIGKIVVDQYPNLEHGVLMDLREWALSTPQAESFIHSFAATNDRLQQLHFAIVANPSALKEFQINQMIKDLNNPNVKVFEDVGEAESWLETFGYIR
jgi:hypothetical protein